MKNHPGNNEYPKTATYGKLVRDRIPAIIKADGAIPQIRIITGQEKTDALKEKLLEESTELKNAVETGDIKKEAADVLEVLYALLDSEDIKLSEVEEIRIKRAESRGGFSEGIFLERTTEKE